MAGPDRVRVTI